MFFGRSFAIFLTVVLSCAPRGMWSTTAFGQPQPNVNESMLGELPNSEAAVDSNQVAALISQLASSAFAERESATLRLLEIGQPALQQLNAVSVTDYELRYRAEQIAKRIEDDRFANLSRSFLLDADGSKSYGLPAWGHFSELVGATRTSKLLFLDMLRQQPELSALVESVANARNSPRTAAAADLSELTEVVASKAAAIFDARMHMQLPEIGDIVAVLVATSLCEGQAPVEVNNLLDSSVHIVPVSSYMRRRGYGNALRKLFALWIPKTHSAMAYQALRISMMNDLETGVIVARKNLTANLDRRLREQAILCLARYGNRSDIPKLIDLLDDETVCLEFESFDLPSFDQAGIDVSNESPPGFRLPEKLQDGEEQQKRWFLYRINDLALCAALLLNQENPQDVFPSFKANPREGFTSRSIAIPKDPLEQEKRSEQIESWKSKYRVELLEQAKSAGPTAPDRQ